MSELGFLNIGYMDFSSLMKLFMLEMEDDDDYYDIVATNLVKNHQEEILNLYDGLSRRQQIAIIWGIGLVERDNEDETLKDFLIQKLSINDPKILRATILSLSRFKNVDDAIIELF